jgi:hypothetical protein
MKIIKLTLIALGVALSIFAANSLWYALIMRGFYENSAGSWMQVSRENPSIPIILLGMFVLAVLMTVLYPRVQLGIQQPILADALFGMLIGLIYVFPASLYYYGTTNFLAFGPMAMDIVWHSIEEGLAGIVLGLLYRRFADQRGSAHRLEVT